jgi:hypothetical protein
MRECTRIKNNTKACEVSGMGVFDFVKNLPNKDEADKWCEAIGTFTGKTEKDFVYTLYGTKKEYYNKYEIVYPIEGGECSSWYSFYPDPEPEAETFSGTTMKIKYLKKKPSIFEVEEE